MARRQAKYVTCVRCGYRGINGDHECDRHAQTVQTVIAGSATPRTELVATPRFEPAPARALEQAVSSILGRRLSIGVQPNVSVDITQRCTACRDEVRSHAPWVDDDTLRALAVAAAARKAYLMHRCPQVEGSLHGFTWDELEQLHVELERDAFKMIERASQIEKLKKERPS